MSQAELVVQNLLEEITRLNRELAIAKANSLIYQQELTTLNEKLEKESDNG